MINENSRYIEIDGWFFEIKTVRAIKSDAYGDAYSAIANFTLQTDKAHIDGLMTKTHEDFSRKDHQTFEKFFSLLGINEVSFERHTNQGFKTFKRGRNTKKEQNNLLKLVQ